MNNKRRNQFNEYGEINSGSSERSHSPEVPYGSWEKEKTQPIPRPVSRPASNRPQTSSSAIWVLLLLCLVGAGFAALFGGGLFALTESNDATPTPVIRPSATSVLLPPSTEPQNIDQQTSSDSSPILPVDTPTEPVSFIEVAMPTNTPRPPTPVPTLKPPTPTEASWGAVLSFTLINAETNEPLSAFNPLENGAVINLATLPTRKLDIRANVSTSSVRSVRFIFDGIVFEYNGRAVENQAPYAMVGDVNGDYYNNWTPSLGTHTVEAIPYLANDARGEPGTSLTITFTVVDR